MNLLTIFIFVLIILLIYTVYKLMTKTTTTVSGFSDASQATTVTSDKLGSSQNFGYSVWVYIDAWQNTSKSKNILTRCNSYKIISRLRNIFTKNFWGIYILDICGNFL